MAAVEDARAREKPLLLRPREAVIGSRQVAHCRESAAEGLSHDPGALCVDVRSEEHTSELQSLMRISYAVFCLKKNNNNNKVHQSTQETNTTSDTNQQQTTT